MKYRLKYLFLILLLSLNVPNELLSKNIAGSGTEIPHLKNVGNATQLIVDEKPFIILGGELGNSSFTSMEYMESIWPKLLAMNLNTVLVPIYWELIEPIEDEFEFFLYDKLIEKAREHKLKLVLLWFGSKKK